MKKSNLLFGLILVFCIPCLRCTREQPMEPNVVLIVIDTLRADHLPMYGYAKNTAPFLLDLSRESVVFENAYSASSWTAPATASIFTSLYPFQHGLTTGLMASANLDDPEVSSTVSRIPEEVRTLTEMMRDNGYRTFAVADNHNICKAVGFSQGFDKFENFYYKSAPEVNRMVKSWKDEITGPGKYYLYLHFMDPHSPLHGREPWYEKKSNFRKDEEAKYDSEINFVDQYIKELYELFGWEENTLLIITADHGVEIWERGRYGHRTSLYNENIHVPFLMHFPKEGRRSIRVDQRVSTIDIYPTLMNYIGADPDKELMGINLMPVIQYQRETPRDRYIFSHLDYPMSTGDNFLVKSAIHNDMKFYQTAEGKELHDLKTDTGETVNLIDEQRDVAENLQKAYETFEKTCKKYDRAYSQYNLGAERNKRLEELGYVK